MKIKKVAIKNYRSIKNLELDISDFSILIGANNSGKSNILRALNFFFLGSEKIVSEDVFSFLEDGDSEVVVAVTFHSLSDQEKNSFKKYFLADETIIIRRICQISKNNNEVNCSNSIYNGWIEEPDRWYLQDSAFDRLSSREKREAETREHPELLPLLDISGRFTKETLIEFQEQFVNEHRNEINFIGGFEETPLLGRQNVASGTLPEVLYIPAVRDLSDETKINSKTLLGKLLLNVLEVMVENDEEFKNIINEVEAAFSKLNEQQTNSSPIRLLERELSEELDSWGASTSIFVNLPNITKLFELGTNLNIDDGVLSGAETKGNGLQRAIIFSFLKVLAQHNKQTEAQTTPRASSESKIFIVEEAELYLHPHKQREFYNNLKKISNDENLQVIITTHSSHFVRMDDYKNLTLIRKQSREMGTIKNQCCEDIFTADTEEKNHYKLIHYINPDNGDMFFARKVILVEGESEKVVFPYLGERVGIYKPDVSIIDCGSKFNLPIYINLLNRFEIPYVVVFDEDPIKDSYINPDKEKADKRTYKFNNTINSEISSQFGTPKMISPDFEGFFSISRTQGDKLGKGLAALKYFQSLEDDKIPESMIDLLEKIYE